MRLKFKEFSEYAERKGYGKAENAFRAAGYPVKALKCMKSACRCGYEFAREMYNFMGRAEFAKVIDFEEMKGVGELERKYAPLCGKLY